MLFQLTKQAESRSVVHICKGVGDIYLNQLKSRCNLLLFWMFKLGSFVFVWWREYLWASINISIPAYILFKCLNIVNVRLRLCTAYFYYISAINIQYLYYSGRLSIVNLQGRLHIVGEIRSILVEITPIFTAIFIEARGIYIIDCV